MSAIYFYNVVPSIPKKVTTIDIDPSNVFLNDTSANFAVNFTTNSDLLNDIQDNLTAENVTISNIALVNYGFALTGTITAQNDIQSASNLLSYDESTDVSGNKSFAIDTLQLAVDAISLTSAPTISFAQSYADNISITFNRDDVSNTVLLESLSVLPVECGTILNVSGSGATRTVTFVPSLSTAYTDCSFVIAYEGLNESNEVFLTYNNSYTFQTDVVELEITSFTISDTSLVFYAEPTATLQIEFTRVLDTNAINAATNLTITPDANNVACTVIRDFERSSDNSLLWTADVSFDYIATDVSFSCDFAFSYEGQSDSLTASNINTYVPEITEWNLDTNRLNYLDTSATISIGFTKTLHVDHPFLAEHCVYDDASVNIVSITQDETHDTSYNIVIESIGRYDDNTKTFNFNYFGSSIASDITLDISTAFPVIDSIATPIAITYDSSATAILLSFSKELLTDDENNVIYELSNTTDYEFLDGTFVSAENDRSLWSVQLRATNYDIENEDVTATFAYNDVSYNTSFHARTIIPNVNSFAFEVENMLYTDVSSAIVIVFNDPTYFAADGKLAELESNFTKSIDSPFSDDFIITMNDALDEDNVTWRGWLVHATNIDSEVYAPSSQLHLAYVDGLVNIDILSNTINIDTRTRAATFGAANDKFTLLYTDYSEDNSAFECEFSITFLTSDLSGQTLDLSYFTLQKSEDINSATFTIVSNGVVADKQWFGKIQTTDEAAGTLTVLYEEPLTDRDDSVIDYRTGSKDFVVDTEIPNITEITAPDQLTYLDTSGSVTIQFDKVVTDPENIFISCESEYYQVQFTSFEGVGTAPFYQFSCMIALDQPVSAAPTISIVYRDESSSFGLPIYAEIPAATSIGFEDALNYDKTGGDFEIEYTYPLLNLITDVNGNITSPAWSTLVQLNPAAVPGQWQITFLKVGGTNAFIRGHVEVTGYTMQQTNAAIIAQGVTSGTFTTSGVITTSSFAKYFDVDMVLPNVDSIAVGNILYAELYPNLTGMSSDFSITFTKDDLNGVNISTAVSLVNASSEDVAIEWSNNGVISNRVASGQIVVNDNASLLANVSLMLMYNFVYGNDKINSPNLHLISDAKTFQIDTEKRSAKIAIADDVTLFTYLSPAADISVTFGTNNQYNMDMASAFSLTDETSNPIAFEFIQYSQPQVVNNQHVWTNKLHILDSINSSSAVLQFSYYNGVETLTDEIENISIATVRPVLQSVSLSVETFLFEENSAIITIVFTAPLHVTDSTFTISNIAVSLDDAQFEDYISISNFLTSDRITYTAKVTAENEQLDNRIASFVVNYNGIEMSVDNIRVDTIMRPISNICFVAGALVELDGEFKAIEKIVCGTDTVNNGMHIKQITRTKNCESSMVMIRRGELSPHVPFKDTIVTQNHKIMYQNKIYTAKKLKKMLGLKSCIYKGETLYNVLLAEPIDTAFISVNGLTVETLNPHNNIARFYHWLQTYGVSAKKRQRMIEIFNKCRVGRTLSMPTIPCTAAASNEMDESDNDDKLLQEPMKIN